MSDTRMKTAAPTIMEQMSETGEPSSTALFSVTVILNEDRGHLVALKQWARDNASSLRRHVDFPLIDVDDLNARFARAMFELGIAAYLGGTHEVDE